MCKVLLSVVTVLLLPVISFSQCTTTNATSCQCKIPGQTDCDLLPDIEVGHPPFYDLGATYGVIEYSQTGNGADDGRLKITVSTPNTGFGPLELRATNIFVCGTDTFVGTAPSICPDGISYPKILINQRIYHKGGNNMTWYDRAAGTMTYHPTHGHMHVDNWGNYSLRIRDTLDPNPLHWQVIGTGTKLAFCVEDYGTCAGYPDHCLDSLGNSLNSNSNFPNYGLGGGGYNCSPTVQGISSGYVDIYWTSLDGMWIDIPPGICNGEYWIVCEVDPNNNFVEENENNNIFAVPFTLTKQEPNPATNPVNVAIANSALNLCQGETVTLSAAQTNPGESYLWSNGDTTSTTTISQGGTYTVQVTNACGTGASLPVTVNVFAHPAAPATTDDTIPVAGQATLSATAGGAINWYDAPVGGNLLGTGNTFTTPLISTTTSFWAESQENHAGSMFHVGPADNTIAGGGYYTGDQSLVFDCFNPFILHAVNVYVQTAGTRTIELRDNQNNLLQSQNVTVTAGLNTLVLDFSVAPGTGYQLTRSGGDMYRNNPGSGIGFPFTIDNFCTITGTTAGAGYYYFFYDWDVRLPDNSCISSRTEAIAYVSSPTLVAGVNELNSLKAYPNPAHNNVTVSFIWNDTDVPLLELTDAIGNVVISRHLGELKGSYEEMLDVSGTAAGVYSIHILSEGKNFYHKLIIQ
ncbi:MAG: T9SS type A sorting domain-containing protein [Bacteroidia bacterium]|nr:T9SS type A sorting domain-containing protein [Bacteroidia bacterium]